MDVDASLLTAHSEKQGAAATYKHGFGFHRCWCSWTVPTWVTVKPSPRCCDLGTAGATPPPITSRCWTWPWRSYLVMPVRPRASRVVRRS